MLNQSLKIKPDAIILHVGTNELRNKKKSELHIAVSGLIARFDPFKERRRIKLVLAGMCFESKLQCIYHPNIDSATPESK